MRRSQVQSQGSRGPGKEHIGVWSEVEARRLLLKGNLFVTAARRAARLILTASFALTVGVHAQAPGSSTSNTDKLPPPPTIDANVNRNDTLANVRYDNKYDIYGGLGFAHFNAGPSLLSGSNLGGFDVQGTRWLTPRLGATANLRGYYGTNATQVNPYGVKGPFVMEHFAMGGISFRAKQNIHAALNLHALFGADIGTFDTALGNAPPPGVGPVRPQDVGFFNNGTTFATALGGSIDLNRSPRIAFRISPEYIYTRFGGVTQNEFALSVGILYRLRIPKPTARPRP